MPPSRAEIEAITRYQERTITRAQLLDLGAASSWIGRRVAADEWQRLYPGVFVVHNGPVSWDTRARGALLYAGAGAALSLEAAAYVHGMITSPPRRLDVDVPAARRVQDQPGLRIHVRRRMPRAYGRLMTVNPADTVLDLLSSSEGTVDETIALITSAVRARTWPREILEAAARRRRLRHRDLLHELLGVVAEGVESPLEHRYRRDVEHRHGLPKARLQIRQRVGGLWIRADAVYVDLGVRVELDGRVAHPDGRTDVDTWRDNAVVVERGELTLRYRWRHVAVTPCATAVQVAAALRTRGWSGRLRPCGPGCAAHQTGQAF